MRYIHCIFIAMIPRGLAVGFPNVVEAVMALFGYCQLISIRDSVFSFNSSKNLIKT